MLESIQIQNIGLVESIRIEFDEEITMFSGETGAGKSMLLSSLLLLLGERADSNTVRQGMEQATITSVWNIRDNKDVLLWLDYRAIDHDGVELLVRRSIKQNGRNQCFIQDQSLTIKEMGECVELLCEVHTQHEHQSLFRPAAQLLIIDKYAGIRERVEQFGQGFLRYNNKLREYKQDLESEQARIRELDYLQFAVQEIEQSKITEGEDETIIEELKSASNIETITALWQKIDARLYDEAGLQSIFREVVSVLTDLESLQAGITPLYERLNSVLIEFEDVAQELKNEKEKVSFLDKEAIGQLETRLLILEGLKRKYGSDLAKVIAYKDSAEKKIVQLQNFEENKSAIEEALKIEIDRLRQEALAISEMRKKAAMLFSKDVNSVLHKLAMEKADFSVLVVDKALKSQGIDDIQFYISSNIGEKSQPLVKVASGGELSRIMLAIKVVSAKNDSQQTLVLDEVDAGIGGNTARILAQYLFELGKKTQIVCVTHLPIIVACAGTHYKVQKLERNNRTIVDMSLLTEDNRIKELARMIVGSEDDRLAQSQAQQMLASYV